MTMSSGPWSKIGSNGIPKTRRTAAWWRYYWQKRTLPICPISWGQERNLEQLELGGKWDLGKILTCDLHELYHNLILLCSRFGQLNDLVLVQTSQGLAKYLLEQATDCRKVFVDQLGWRTVTAGVVITIFKHVVRPSFSKSVETIQTLTIENSYCWRRDFGSGRGDHWWHTSCYTLFFNEQANDCKIFVNVAGAWIRGCYWIWRQIQFRTMGQTERRCLLKIWFYCVSALQDGSDPLGTVRSEKISLLRRDHDNGLSQS